MIWKWCQCGFAKHSGILDLLECWRMADRYPEGAQHVPGWIGRQVNRFGQQGVRNAD